MKGRVLIVDPEPGLRQVVGELFEQAGHRALSAASADEARELVQREAPDLVLVEVFLRGEDGLELIRDLSGRHPETVFLGMGLEIPATLAASFLDAGALVFVDKPLDSRLLLATIERALSVRSERLEAAALRRLAEAGRRGPEPWLAGEPWGDRAALLAGIDGPVLLHGEPGVAPVEVAREIHARSSRRALPCVALTALQPHEAIARELDAGTEQRRSTAELVAGGTLIIEHGEALPAKLQRRLAVQLETGLLAPRDDRSPPLGARVLFCTGVSPHDPEASRQLAPALLRRFEGRDLEIPPLRERLAVFPELVEATLTALGHSGRISPAAQTFLRSRPWPGNLVQLRAVLSGALTQAGPGGLIEPAHLARWFGVPEAGEDPRPGAPTPPDEGALASLPLSEVEKRHIARVLTHNKGNKMRTARVLDINVKTLYNKIRGYDLDL